MGLFKKKHIETNEKNILFIYKCDEIADINDITIGSFFTVTVSNDTQDVIISIAKELQDNLVSAFTVEDHNKSYKTAKLSVTLVGSLEPKRDNRAKIILPRCKLNFDIVKLSGAVNMIGGHFNACNSKLLISGAAQIKASVDSHRMEIDSSGASSVIFDGTIHTLVIDAEGSSSVYVGGVINHNTIVEARGAASVLINPSDSATGHATGAATIVYPRNVIYEDIKTSGAAKKEQT